MEIMPKTMYNKAIKKSKYTYISRNQSRVREKITDFYIISKKSENENSRRTQNQNICFDYNKAAANHMQQLRKGEEIL